MASSYSVSFLAGNRSDQQDAAIVLLLHLNHSMLGDIETTAKIHIVNAVKFIHANILNLLAVRACKNKREGSGRIRDEGW